MCVQDKGTGNLPLQYFIRGYEQFCSIAGDYEQKRGCTLYICRDGHCFPQTLEASRQYLDIFCNRQRFGCSFEFVASFLNTLGIPAVGQAHGGTKL